MAHKPLEPASGRKVARIATASAGVAITLTLALAGCAAPTTGNTPQPAPTDTQTKAPSVPGAETEVDVTTFPENVVELGTFNALTPEQQARVTSLEAMSVDEFRAQPEVDQLAFAKLVYDNNLPILQYRLDQTDQSDVYAIGDPDSPEGMVKADALNFALMSSLKTFTESDGLAFDSETASKLTVLITDNDDELGNQRTASIDESVAGWTANTPSVVNIESVTASRTNEDGTVVVSIFNETIGLDYQTTYSAKQDFLSINGEAFSIHRQVLSITSEDPRYIPLG